MTPPKVSVIIPTYNRAHLLPRAINSALNQAFQDFEIIIVDDGSTDNTEEVVGKFNDKRIIYLKHTANKGPSAARNTGIKNSKGKYIALLDSDDEWLPEKLEEQLRVFTKPRIANLGLVGCNIYLVRNAKIRESILSNFQDFLSKLLQDNFSNFQDSSFLIKREVFDKIGLFDEKLDCEEDLDMGIRMVQKYNFDFVNRPLYKYYIHEESISGIVTSAQKEKTWTYLLKKHKNLYANYPAAKGKILKQLGTLNLLSGNNKKAREYFIESIKISPTLRNILTFLFSFLGKNIYKKVLDIKRKPFLPIRE